MDLSGVTGNYFANVHPTFTTTLAADAETNDTTVTLTSLANYTTGDIVALAIDPKTADQQIVMGVVNTSTNELTSCVWTEATATITHTAGTTVRDMVTATHFGALTKGLKTFFNQTGVPKTDSVPIAAVNDAWTSFTPVFTGTGFSLGNGTVLGRKQVTNNHVRFTAKITFGSTTTMTTTGNELKITLPETAANGGLEIIGHMYLLAGGVYWFGPLAKTSTTQATPWVGEIVSTYSGRARGLDVYNVGNVAGHAIYVSGEYEI